MPVGFPDYYGGLTLPVTVQEGGTGQTSVTSKALLYGAGTSKLIETNVGTANQILQINSVTLDPTFQDVDISGGGISGILPLANGGTGTATPSLTAGTGISITGTWPDNTITNSSNYASLADPLPIAHGGTGTTTAALTAGSNISITGTWPNNTIALSSPLQIGTTGATDNVFAHLATVSGQSYYGEIGNTSSTVSGIEGSMFYVGGQTVGKLLTVDASGNLGVYGLLHLGGALATNYGGTGTTSPSLTAGTNISITGTWPNNTIAVSNSPNFSGTLTAVGPIEAASNFYPGFDIANVAGTLHWQIREFQGNGSFGFFFINDAVNNIKRVEISTAGNITLSNKIESYNGSTLAGVGIPSIVSIADNTNEDPTNPASISFTPASDGFYRISGYAVTTTAGSAGTGSLVVAYNDSTGSQSITVVSSWSLSIVSAQTQFTAVVYAAGGYPISVEIGTSGVTGSPKIDIHTRMEAM